MRIQLVGPLAGPRQDLFRRAGLEIVTERPDVIVALGGDGTLIGAERTYPGVPKLAMRDSDVCEKCPKHRDDVVIARLARGDLVPTELPKIECLTGTRRLLGMNDVIIRNRDPRSGVRFRVRVNGEAASEEMIGDGLVVATPFGSSAYFRSITRATFRAGLGVAFNNCTDVVNHMILRDTDMVDVEFTRGPADLAADNDPETLTLDTGAAVSLRTAPDVARLLSVDTLRCPDCRYVHAPRRRF